MNYYVVEFAWKPSDVPGPFISGRFDGVRAPSKEEAGREVIDNLLSCVCNRNTVKITNVSEM